MGIFMLRAYGIGSDGVTLVLVVIVALVLAFVIVAIIVLSSQVLFVTVIVAVITAKAFFVSVIVIIAVALIHGLLNNTPRTFLPTVTHSTLGFALL